MGKEEGLAPGNILGTLDGRQWNKKDGEVGAGDRPFLFDLFSLFFLDFSAL